MSPGWWPTVNVDPPEYPMLDCLGCGEPEEECECSVMYCRQCGRPVGSPAPGGSQWSMTCHDELLGADLLIPAHWREPSQGEV